VTPHPMPFPNEYIEAIGWSEDLDTNAAAAAAAAIPEAYQKHVELSGTDQIISPSNDTYLHVIITADETPPTTDMGYLSITGYSEPIRLPPSTKGDPGWMLFDPPLRLPPNTKIDCVINGSGSGIEEHQCILLIENPEMIPWAVGNVDGMQYPAEMVTDAPAAAHSPNYVDICGRDNAYENSQTAIADVDDIDIELEAVTMMATAGYGAVCIRDPKREKILILPVIAGYPHRWVLADILGGSLICRADEPLQVGNLGVTTGTQQLLLEMVVTGTEKAFSSVAAKRTGSNKTVGTKRTSSRGGRRRGVPQVPRGSKPGGILRRMG